MAYVICVLAGALAGFFGRLIYDKKVLKEKQADIDFLEGQIKEGQAEFIDMRNKINDNGDLIIEKQKKIDALKQKAMAVKDENKKDNIDDLINFFDN